MQGVAAAMIVASHPTCSFAARNPRDEAFARRRVEYDSIVGVVLSIISCPAL
jgi:hypothetical protein